MRTKSWNAPKRWAIALMLIALSAFVYFDMGPVWDAARNITSSKQIESQIEKINADFKLVGNCLDFNMASKDETGHSDTRGCLVAIYPSLRSYEGGTFALALTVRLVGLYPTDDEFREAGLAFLEKAKRRLIENWDQDFALLEKFQDARRASILIGMRYGKQADIHYSKQDLIERMDNFGTQIDELHRRFIEALSDEKKLELARKDSLSAQTNPY